MKIFIGIDISEARGCALAALDQNGRSVGARWANCNVADILSAVREMSPEGEAAVAVDAPRMALSAPRQWYWDSRRSRWRHRIETESGWGRHCEVVIKSLSLANPQWTPSIDAAPGWMRFGFELFDALSERQSVCEVFPSASYTQLANGSQPFVTVPFTGFASGPKDMLDAYVAAVTVMEYEAGRGCAVGGGDGLGQILLPRPVQGAKALFDWPDSAL